jgi:hypothetical protein
VDAGVPEFIDRQMELPYGHSAYFYLKGPFLDNSPPTLGYQLVGRESRGKSAPCDFCVAKLAAAILSR